MPNLSERTFAKIVSKTHADLVGGSYAHMPKLTALETLLSERPLLSESELMSGTYPGGPEGVRYVLGAAGCYRVVDRKTNGLTFSVCMPVDPVGLSASLMRDEPFGPGDRDLRAAGTLELALHEGGVAWRLVWATSRSSGEAKGADPVELARSIADACAGHMGLSAGAHAEVAVGPSKLPIPLWTLAAAFTVCWVFYWGYQILMGGLYGDKLGLLGMGLGGGLLATYVLKWMSRAD